MNIIRMMITANVVPEAGVEPAWKLLRRILSPVRLPIPPLGQIDGDPLEIRTPDPLIKSQVLYHLS